GAFANQHNNKDQRKHHHDGGRRSAVQKEAGIVADKAGQYGNDDSADKHGTKAARQHESDGARCNEQTDDQDDAYRFQGPDNGQGQHEKQAVVQQAYRQHEGSGQHKIKGMQQEVAPLEPNDARYQQGNGTRLHQITIDNTQHVTKKDMVQMHVGTDAGVEHDAQPEHAGRHHAHDGILLEPAV